MERFTLAQAAEWTKGETAGDAVLTAVSTDSRRIPQEALFLPLAGERFDGHDFIGKALENGAAAVMSHRECEEYPVPALYVGNTSQALLDLAGGYRMMCGGSVVGVNVQFRFNIANNTNLVVATGPYLACGVGGKAKFDGEASIGNVGINADEKIDTFGDDGLGYNRFDAGWNIGLGVEFGQILVGLDTQLGFCKIMDGNAPHNANIGITVGYKF